MQYTHEEVRMHFTDIYSLPLVVYIGYVTIAGYENITLSKTPGQFM